MQHVLMAWQATHVHVTRVIQGMDTLPLLESALPLEDTLDAQMWTNVQKELMFVLKMPTVIMPGVLMSATATRGLLERVNYIAKM